MELGVRDCVVLHDTVPLTLMDRVADGDVESDARDLVAVLLHVTVAKLEPLATQLALRPVAETTTLVESDSEGEEVADPSSVAAEVEVSDTLWESEGELEAESDARSERLTLELMETLGDLPLERDLEASRLRVRDTPCVREGVSESAKLVEEDVDGDADMLRDVEEESDDELETESVRATLFDRVGVPLTLRESLCDTVCDCDNAALLLADTEADALVLNSGDAL
jgi:hypothetical protein